MLYQVDAQQAGAGVGVPQNLAAIFHDGVCPLRLFSAASAACHRVVRRVAARGSNYFRLLKIYFWTRFLGDFC
jgi:hypothetical protein